MRIRALIPPTVVVVLSAIWLTSQRHTIATIESNTAVLSNARAVTAPDAMGSRVAMRSPFGGQINWHRTGEIGAQPYRGVFAKQEWLRFQKRVGAMTPAELIAALDEVHALEGDVHSRDALHRELITELGKKDPEAAMNRLTEQVEFRDFGLTDTILAQWAAEDSAAAAAWLDGKIAGGNFKATSPEGKNGQHLRYEAALFGTMLKTDPDAAAERLSSLSENHRADMLARSIERTPLADAELQTYVGLVRDLVPESRQSELLVKPVSKLAAKPGFDQIDDYLDAIEATSAERRRSVELTSRAKSFPLIHNNRLNIEELDKLRSWIATQAPAEVEAATSGILQNVALNGDSGLDRAVELALHYQQTTGSDDILVRFLSSSFSPTHRSRVRPLAERIADDEQRTKILEHLDQ